MKFCQGEIGIKIDLFVLKKSKNNVYKALDKLLIEVVFGISGDGPTVDDPSYLQEPQVIKKVMVLRHRSSRGADEILRR